MKKIVYLLSVLTLIITSNIYAIGYKPGPYLGGQIGWGRIDEGEGYKKYVDGKNDIGSFAWRAYVGYSIARFFSVETGYSAYPDNRYSSGSKNIKVKAYTVDVVGKIILPLGGDYQPLASFSIYGKGGAAYSNTKTSGSITGKTMTTIMPAYGAGLIYNFTDNIAIDASWTSVMGRNYIESADLVGKNSPVPTCNMFTLGLSYKITDIF